MDENAKPVLIGGFQPHVVFVHIISLTNLFSNGWQPPDYVGCWQAQIDLLKELETRLQWLDEMETGVGHPRLSELQRSFGSFAFWAV